MSQPLPPTLRRYSLWAALGIAALIILHSLFFHLRNPEPVNIITWDVYGYYSYLPAIITYGDAHYYAFANDHFKAYDISQNLFQIADVNGDYRAPIYTIGMAVIWLPGYLVASLVAWLIPGYANDGMSPPFQWAVVMTNWAFVVLGLFYFRKTLLHFFTESVTAVALLIVFLATNYYHYAVFEPGMSHTYLLTLYAALLYYTIRWHKQPQVSTTVAIGVSVAMLCLARPSEGISLLLPLLFGVVGFTSLKAKAATVARHWPMVVWLAFTGISIISIQVVYWKWSADVWIFNGYAEEHHFDWLAPHIHEGLFSYRKGWLLYTPVMLLALFGLLKMGWQLISSKASALSVWTIPVWSFFILNLYIVLSWHMWWYASSFGSRALVQSYAVLALPIAAFLTWSFRRKWVGAIVCSFAAACLALNQFQDWQYRNRILTFDKMTSSFYWNAWGSTTFDPNAFYLIDNDERLANRADYLAEPLMTFNAVSDTTSVLTKVEIDEKIALQQRPENAYAATQRLTISSVSEADRLSGKWVEVTANVQMSSTRFDSYKCAKLVFSIAGHPESKLWRGVNMQRYRPADEWFEVKYQLQLPSTLRPGDEFTLVSWNTSPDTIYIEEMEVSLLLEK